VWHLFRKSSCSSLAGRAASSTFCRGIRLIARGPERSIGSRRGSGIVSLIAATRNSTRKSRSSIARGGASCRVCKIFHPRCGPRVCGPSARIADTSEKAFTAIPSDDEVWLSMAGRFSKSRCIHPGRVRARKSACDSFICKQTVDVIRIYPLIPFIFYSRAARLRSAKADVRARLRLVLSADPSARAQPFRSSSVSLARACALNERAFSRIREAAAVPDTDSISSAADSAEGACRRARPVIAIQIRCRRHLRAFLRNFPALSTWTESVQVMRATSGSRVRG